MKKAMKGQDEALLRSRLKQASAMASDRYSIGGSLKETYAPRPITLPTLETKRALDREIWPGRRIGEPQ
jgi:hypothetical protein